MLVRLLTNSLARRRSRKLLAVATVWIGLSLVVALVAVNLDVRDKMSREMGSFGANITVAPIATSLPVRVGGYEIASGDEGATLQESDLDGLATMFWRNNILDVCARLWTRASTGGRNVPVLGVWLDRELSAPGGDPLVTGARQLYGHWEVEGAWPSAGHGSARCLVGRDLADDLGIEVGDALTLENRGRDASFTVAGIVTTGGREDGAVIASLDRVQALAGLEGRISEVEVSALTTPENKLAEKYALDPTSLAPAEYERWVCTPYPGSVAAGIQEAIPGAAARVVRRVSETQGAVLGRIAGLMLFLAAVTLVACGLGVHGVLTSAVEERRSEMALMQALGAHQGDVRLLFLGEAAVLGIAGGLLAAATGSLLGQILSKMVFGSAPETHLLLFVVAPALGLVIAWWGSHWTVRRALGADTATVLHGS